MLTIKAYFDELVKYIELSFGKTYRHSIRFARL